MSPMFRRGRSLQGGNPGRRHDTYSGPPPALFDGAADARKCHRSRAWYSDTVIAVPQSTTQDEALVAELHRLGVQHLARLSSAEPDQPISAAALFVQLAGHSQARFRSALILVFLRQPGLAHAVPAALEQCSIDAATTLRLFYQAAVYLQPDVLPALPFEPRSRMPLPDLFSAELGLPAPGTIPVDDALQALAERHRALTGLDCNWVGTYRQHLPLFLRQLGRHADAHAA